MIPKVSSTGTMTLYTVKDAAEKVGVMRQTLTSWIDAGLVTPQYSAGGRVMFDEKGLKAIEEQQAERGRIRKQMRLPHSK